ncbi:MAG: hypothetical protein LAP13_07865 [Acidobacteriia bacterium]|nr:hypothetical protein [Terriglobia bacterium]
MADPKIPEENSLETYNPQSLGDSRSPVQSITLRYFNCPTTDASGLIDYLATASDDRLGEFALQQLGHASECRLAARKKFFELAELIVDQREAERAATTQTARDGHIRRQKLLTTEMVTVILEMAESRIQHLVLKELAELALKLPVKRSPTLKPARGIRKEIAHETTQSIRPAQTPDDRIKELVDQRVAEVLADPEDLGFGSWFRQRARANEIRRHQTSEDRDLCSRYFAKWGCFCCGKKDAGYGGNMCCARCYVRERGRINALRNSQPDPPRVIPDPQRIAQLKAAGRSWREISLDTGVARTTAQRVFYALSKTPDNGAAGTPQGVAGESATQSK